MIKTILTLAFCLLSLPVFAQDKPQANSKPTTPAPEVKLPESAEINAEKWKAIQQTAQSATLAATQAENLDLKIKLTLQQVEEARKQLKELQEKASAEQRRVQAEIAKEAGLPADKLAEYTPEEKDGKLILKRKAQAPPAPEKKN